MTRALCITTTFLTGRYHGREWPPSPARLVQALLAGVMTGGYREYRAIVEPALLWLERQPAPRISAVPAAEALPYRLAVPNNDMDVIAREWATGRPANPAELRTMKTVRPRLIEAPPPHLRYLWPVDGAAGVSELLAAASRLCRCMHTLGWGIDMSFADAELLERELPDGDSYETWEPCHPPGTPLAVPVPGFLEDLQQTYARFTRRASGTGVDTDTRPSVYRLQCYGRVGERVSPSVALGLRDPRHAAPFSKPWRAAMVVSAWLRHAAKVALERERFDQTTIDSFVLGHTAEGADPGERVSFVPLPTIGYENADGAIRRVLIVEPAGSSGSVCRILERKLPGWLMTDDDGRETACLVPLEDRRVLWRYQRRARLWRSVTPVVLHGYNSSHGKISLAKTERLLLRAFEMAGYGEDSIQRLAFQQAPLWRGCGAAGQIEAPLHLRGLPRYHVEVEFRTPVSGPVLAGLGRHCGLGVFAAPGDGNGGA